MPDFSAWSQQVEIIAVLLSFAYLYLLIKENKWCWWFGIASSGISIFLFIDSKLYAEAILYCYYVIIGLYGFWLWNKKMKQASSRFEVSLMTLNQHVKWIGIGILGAVGLGYLLDHKTDADKAYLDSTTTIFSFIASYFETKKLLGAWTYWVIINLITVFLYFSKELYYYTGMQIVYTIFSIVGYYQWKKQLAQPVS